MALRGWRERLARLVLSGFEPEEVDEVLRDLRELAEARGRLRGEAYFWLELVKYPIREALDRFAHREHHIEEQREGWSGMDGLLRDARYAVRSLARSAGFTAMSTDGQGVHLDPHAAEEPERLVS